MHCASIIRNIVDGDRCGHDDSGDEQVAIKVIYVLYDMMVI